MKHSKLWRDPFHDIQPQVPAHEPPPPPPELLPIDDKAHGGKNVKPQVLTDEGFRAGFTHEKEHTKEYDYSKGKK
jgi:hypothetical protein